jgi:hypothetical protein
MRTWPAALCLCLIALLSVGPLASEAAAQNGLAAGGQADRAHIFGAVADRSSCC